MIAFLTNMLVAAIWLCTHTCPVCHEACTDCVCDQCFDAEVEAL